jgi:hypothetical protein
MDNNIEYWKPIDNYERYYVSSFGRAKVIKPSGELHLVLQLRYKRKKDRVIKRPNTAYYHVNVCKNGKRRKLALHILVAKAFIPNPENKAQVNHIDGIKLNSHVSNLEWATHLENQHHATANGLRPHGELNGHSKLTTKEVLEIKNLLLTAKFGDQKEIAKRYNIGAGVISDIKTGRKWRHLL